MILYSKPLPRLKTNNINVENLNRYFIFKLEIYTRTYIIFTGTVCFVMFY